MCGERELYFLIVTCIIWEGIGTGSASYLKLQIKQYDKFNICRVYYRIWDSMPSSVKYFRLPVSNIISLHIPLTLGVA